MYFIISLPINNMESLFSITIQYILCLSLFFGSNNRAVLFPVFDDNIDGGVFGFEMGGELLGAVDGAVLPAGAPESDAEMREVALDVLVHTLIHNGLDVLEEKVDSILVGKEIDDRAVFARVGLVFGIAPRVGQGPAVEDMSPAVAAGVFR